MPWLILLIYLSNFCVLWPLVWVFFSTHWCQIYSTSVSRLIWLELVDLGSSQTVQLSTVTDLPANLIGPLSTLPPNPALSQNGGAQWASQWQFLLLLHTCNTLTGPLPVRWGQLTIIALSFFMQHLSRRQTEHPINMQLLLSSGCIGYANGDKWVMVMKLDADYHSTRSSDNDYFQCGLIYWLFLS